MSDQPISDLRRRMLQDMAVRQFGEKTQHDYIRHIEAFARFSAARPRPLRATTCGGSSSSRLLTAPSRPR
jgi:hypothetical protein